MDRTARSLAMETFHTVSFEPGGQTVVETHQINNVEPKPEGLQPNKESRQLRLIRRVNRNTRVWDAA